jgi:hypothetical protein
MSDTYPDECVMICTVADRDAAERMAVAMGHSDAPGTTFCVPLSADGLAVTHYGTCAYVRDYWGAMIAGARAGTVPPAPWELVGLTPELVTALINRMIVDTATAAAPRVRWESVLAAHGLVEVVVAGG